VKLGQREARPGRGAQRPGENRLQRSASGAGRLACAPTPRRCPILVRAPAVALAALLVGAACGTDERSEPAPAAAAADLEELERLAALGYVSGSAAATSAGGVTLHDPERAATGFNLAVSGHAPGATLLDMDGNLLHEWRVSFEQVWPGREVLRRFRDANWFRRAHLFENGDLIGIWGHDAGILKLDRDSNVIWASTIRAHHDLRVMPNGDIYVLLAEHHIVPRVNPRRPIREDFIAILDAAGRVKRSISLLEAFENSERYRYLWMLHPKKTGVIFHTNTVEVLDGSIADEMPEFEGGRVLTSMRAMNTIAVVDLERAEVVWAHQGGFEAQHDPQVLDDGSLLLFDNKDEPGRSSVEAYAPRDMSLRWVYRGTPEQPFYSQHSGAVQRLANGNTLITDSADGRAFEVTPDGERVWEFSNPHRVADDAELRATLFEMLRLPPGFDVSWASAGPR